MRKVGLRGNFLCTKPHKLERTFFKVSSENPDFSGTNTCEQIIFQGCSCKRPSSVNWFSSQKKIHKTISSNVK